MIPERHTREGWWLEEAGAVEPSAPLSGRHAADVVIVGGGYLGLWTAWQIKCLEPEAEVAVVEAGLCGHGPSGRNGGFVSTLWDELPNLRAMFGDEAAVRTARASERGVHGIADFCRTQSVDAWLRFAPTMYVSTNRAQIGCFDDVIRSCAETGHADEITAIDTAEARKRCNSPLFLGGALVRLSATVQPARLALGLRDRVRRAGVRIFENSPVRRISSESVTTSQGCLEAGQVVLAVNSRTTAFPGLRCAMAVASSHMVITEPVPEVLEEVGWTGGEAIADGRTLLHYFRTTPDGRIAFGWAGGRMGFGARALACLEVDVDVVRRTVESLVRFFPALRGRRIVHAWGGPIDVSPTHLPVFGSRGRVHHGFGFTGNGVGPAYLGGEILARLALDRRDELTRLPLVDPPRQLMPPEPLRWAGGSVIRGALLRRDEVEDTGTNPGVLVTTIAGLPRRLGWRLPR
jgi:glycine/D-amino acid oxidase-like deaminating enzyme